MRKIYSCIDIGSHSIKLIVLEKLNNRFVVLSKSIVKSKGVRDGFIISEDDALLSIKKALKKVEDDLGINIKNILCLVPSNDSKFIMREASITIESGIVEKNDITKLLQKTVEGIIIDDEVLVSISPIFYQLDGGDNVKKVLGLNGTYLKVKAVVSTIPRKNVRVLFNIFKRLDINIVDVGFRCLGDYFTSNNSKFDNTTCGVINIGYDTIELGVFNKGILIKTDVIDMGSRLIDKEISYKYNLETKKVRYLKENFAVCSTRYADVYETIDIVDKDQNTISINQLEISEIIEKRIQELLKNSKKQINVLTNKEIHYIIVTGGISEIMGFQYILDSIFGNDAVILTINNMGIRTNSYSSAMGYIYSFAKRLEERGKVYSMISDSELNINTRRKGSATSDSGLGGILNYFTGNRED